MTSATRVLTLFSLINLVNYVDRYVVRNGLIAEMDVWNDSAEWLLIRAGLATL